MVDLRLWMGMRRIARPTSRERHHFANGEHRLRPDGYIHNGSNNAYGGILHQGLTPSFVLGIIGMKDFGLDRVWIGCACDGKFGSIVSGFQLHLFVRSQMEEGGAFIKQGMTFD